MSLPQKPEQPIQQTITHNVFISMICTAFHFVLRLFIPPIVLSYVSLEEYGIWAYCLIFIGYFGLSVIGVTNVYVRFVASYIAKGKTDKINRLVSTGIIAVLGFCILIIPTLWFCLPKILDYLQVSPTVYHTTFLLTFGTLTAFSIEIAAGVFSYVLQGIQQIGKQKIIWAIASTIETVLIVVFLLAGMGIYALFWAFLTRIILSTLLSAIACFHAVPTLSIRFKHFDSKMLRHFYRFGGVVQIVGIVGVTSRAIEKLIAGFFIGAEAIALFEIGEKFPITAMTLPGTINEILLPAKTLLYAQQEKLKIVKLYLKSSRVINLLMGSMMGFCSAFSYIIMTCWLGPEPKYVTAATIMVIFSLAYQIEIVTGPASALYRSIKKPGTELMYGLSELLFATITTSIGFAIFGYSVIVIALAVAIAMVSSSLLYISYSNRLLYIKQYDYWKSVMLPGFIPYAFGYGLLFLSRPWLESITHARWEIFYYLITMLGTYSAIVFVFIYCFICDENEKNLILQQLNRVWKKLTSYKEKTQYE